LAGLPAEVGIGIPAVHCTVATIAIALLRLGGEHPIEIAGYAAERSPGAEVTEAAARQCQAERRSIARRWCGHIDCATQRAGAIGERVRAVGEGHVACVAWI